MPRRSILSAAERESLLALPDTKDELIRSQVLIQGFATDSEFTSQLGLLLASLDTLAQLDRQSTQPFPNSRKVYLTGSRPDIRVPVREISLADWRSSCSRRVMLFFCVALIDGSPG